MSWTKKRAEWRKARDTHGVKSGSVSGVSIGDAIDKVVKAEDKGYGALLTAAKALKTDLVKYQTGLKKIKTKGDLSAWISKNLMKDVDKLIADVTADLKSVTDLRDTARKSVELRAIIPEIGLVGSADELMKSDPTLTWLDALKQLRDYKLVIAAAKELSATAKEFQSIKLKYPLKKDYQKYLVSFGKQLQADIVFCVKWVSNENREDFITTLRPAKGREWAHDKQGDLGRVFDFLT